MSRVGKKPVNIPDKVKAAIENNVIKIEGPKGKLEYAFDSSFKVEIKEGLINVIRPSNARPHLSRHGLIRTLIQNMIIGVVDGYKKELEIHGVGFKAQVQGTKLNIQLGYSHPINYDIPEGITIQTPKATSIVVSGIDKSRVGEIAAEIRHFCIPEPYKGKGIRYKDEHVRHKAGKTVA